MPLIKMPTNLRQRTAQGLTQENLDNADVGPVLQTIGSDAMAQNVGHYTLASVPGAAPLGEPIAGRQR